MCATDDNTLLDIAEFEFLCRDEKRPIDITGRQLEGEALERHESIVHIHNYGLVINAKNSNIAVDSPNAQVGDVSNVTLHLEDMRRVAQDRIFEENERKLLLEVISTLAKAQAADGQQAALGTLRKSGLVGNILNKLHGLHKRAQQANDALAPYLQTIQMWLAFFPPSASG